MIQYHHFTAALLLLMGCGSTSHQPTATPAPTASELSEVTVMPRCGAAETPALSSYLEAREGDDIVRHLEVRRDPGNGVWVPASHVEMPMNHATAIQWTNLDDLPILAAATGERMRFAFSLSARDTRQTNGDEEQWETTYAAQISSVCEISDDTSRATGVHIPDVHISVDECERLENAVVASVQAAAHCTSDADCIVRDAPACDLSGLGCSWMVIRRDADAEPVLAAIRARQSQCPVSSCDCPRPPATARCADAVCVAP